ncbi:MAG: T9SS C-terminal target domain-containing protein, partial [Calditrichaeota bacterium]
ARITSAGSRNPGTTIRYRLATPGEVELAIYDVLGRRVRTLAQGKQEAGTHTAHWDGRDEQGQVVGTGIYLYRLQAGKRVQVRRMVVIH